jgi:hypothetical protein
LWNEISLSLLSREYSIRRKASIVSKRMVMTNEKIFSFLRKRNKKVECLRYIFPRPENSSNFASTWFLFNSVTNRSIVFFFIILKIKFFFYFGSWDCPQRVF